MPIIVPIEENHEGIAGLTDAKFRAPDYSGSGLEALGAGLARLGDGGQQMATTIDEKRRRAAAAIAAAHLDDMHQGNIDDAAVKKAYVDYSDGSAKQLYGEDGLFNKQGADAHAALPHVVLALADTHDKATAQLDKIQREIVAPALKEQLRIDVERAAEHVRWQGVAEQQLQSVKLQKATWRDAVANADDPDLHDHHIETGKKTIRQQAKMNNLSDTMLAKQLADYTSGVHADTIDTLTPHDSVHAAGWYARYGGNLNQRDKQRVEATLGPALANARAVADVDAVSAGDPTIAPANPHAGDDATLLLKMQGITPMMDQTTLPALMQRYGSDPAKAWAAFEAGPDTVDRLVAQRSDDWYAGLDDDTRRFVDGNMRMLGGANSSRDLPADPQVFAAWIDAQPWGALRKSAARQELDRRIGQHRAADIASMVPTPLANTYGSLQPASYPQPELYPADLAPDAHMTEGSAPFEAAGPVAESHAQEGGRAPVKASGGKPQRVFPQVTIDSNRAQAEADLKDPHFRALMLLIGRYEGPDNPNIGNGYYTINRHLKKGDGLKDLSRFPTELGDTAVGRYQMKQSTSYAYAAPALGVTAFSPHEQDLMAAYIIRKRGMFAALSSGDFQTAAKKIHPIWVSFPRDAGKPLPQQHVTFDEFVRDYQTELAKIEQGDETVRQVERLTQPLRLIGAPLPDVPGYGAFTDK